MQQTQNQYPDFVPDQLLTAGQLNRLFGYLDEQERLTRANLIGIGIVCGLEIVLGEDSKTLTITAGCGVTSKGYLITFPETRFAAAKPYDAGKDILYPPFFKNGTQLPLFELVKTQNADATALSQDFLDDKAVLIFVELLENKMKNCDVNSCDDKGQQVAVTFRPLLVSVGKFEKAPYAPGKLSHKSPQAGRSIKRLSAVKLPVLRMPRYDVTATTLRSAAAVLEGFAGIINRTFITRLRNALTKVYGIMDSRSDTDGSANPFEDFLETYSFLYDGSIDGSQLLYFQYFYDFFSDLLLAYGEFRGQYLSGDCQCCPDDTLFPRHLMLGLATAKPGDAASRQIRQELIPSPAVGCCQQGGDMLRALYTRLVLMVTKFRPSLDARKISRFIRPQIRITPSTLGGVPLGTKAIPFYYAPAAGIPPLYEYWDYRKTKKDEADRNLSYYASQYNESDDDVLHPLDYDLEPYNFLRIEGHVGRPWQEALQEINDIRNRYRLPFELLALNADVASLRALLASLKSGIKQLPPAGSTCEFRDLEALYGNLRAELVCGLCRDMRLYYDRPYVADQPYAAAAPDKYTNLASVAPVADGTVPVMGLLKACAPGYRVSAGTLGTYFEAWYRSVYEKLRADSSKILRATALRSQNNLWTFLLLMERVFETLAERLEDFDYDAFSDRLDTLNTEARLLLERFDDKENTDAIYRLPMERWAQQCAAALGQLYEDYLIRLTRVETQRLFGYFARQHPGISHKAGVPKGGTFILVYREAATRKQGAATKATAVSNTLTNVRMKRFDEATASARRFADDDATERLRWKPAATKDAAATEKLFSSLLENIPTGTVIADFFVPYVCSCPCDTPGAFWVPTGPEKEPPEDKTDQPGDQPEEPATDPCGDLSRFYGRFNDLRTQFSQLDPNGSIWPGELDGFFETLQTVSGQGTEAQQQFLKDKLTSKDFAPLVERAVRILISSSENPEMQAVARDLLLLLLSVLSYGSCVKQQTKGGASVSSLESLWKRVKELVSSADFRKDADSEAGKAFRQLLANLLKEATDRSTQDIPAAELLVCWKIVKAIIKTLS